MLLLIEHNKLNKMHLLDFTGSLNKNLITNDGKQISDVPTFSFCRCWSQECTAARKLQFCPSLLLLLNLVFEPIQ